MREILFRGKRMDNGEFVEGALVIKHDPLLEISYCFIIAQGKKDSFVTWHKVDPDTVGQYTGLTDMQDAKIFEGDIVQFGGEYGKIEYSENEAMFQVVFEGWLTDFDHLRGTDVVVIGNIHDNPELMDGGDEDGKDTAAVRR